MEENKDIENNNLQINKEELQNMTVEDLVDLKIKLDDMVRTVDELIAKCNGILKEEV